MRTAFVEAMLQYVVGRDVLFLTGDLGFNALEPLQEFLGSRFINCGVAEQNMIGVAAGLARSGHEAWVYSIAPFCYARPFEQIRNDICLNRLPVRLVGNGGGYAYGVMGPTHHALEDYGILLTLPRMRVHVPARDEDILPILTCMGSDCCPAYLRLGRDEFPTGAHIETYAQWRHAMIGEGPIVIACGPIAGLVYSTLGQDPGRPDLWIVSQLPLLDQEFPILLQERLAERSPLLVIEEHGLHGGVGMVLTHLLAQKGIWPSRFVHLYAKGYISGRYGSQAFHRRESGLDSTAIRHAYIGLT